MHFTKPRREETTAPSSDQQVSSPWSFLFLPPLSSFLASSQRRTKIFLFFSFFFLGGVKEEQRFPTLKCSIYFFLPSPLSFTSENRETLEKGSSTPIYRRPLEHHRRISSSLFPTSTPHYKSNLLLLKLDYQTSSKVI